jgi:hypothetical protein
MFFGFLPELPPAADADGGGDFEGEDVPADRVVVEVDLLQIPDPVVGVDLSQLGD